MRHKCWNFSLSKLPILSFARILREQWNAKFWISCRRPSWKRPERKQVCLLSLPNQHLNQFIKWPLSILMETKSRRTLTVSSRNRHQSKIRQLPIYKLQALSKNKLIFVEKYLEFVPPSSPILVNPWSVAKPTSKYSRVPIYPGAVYDVYALQIQSTDSFIFAQRTKLNSIFTQSLDSDLADYCHRQKPLPVSEISAGDPVVIRDKAGLKFLVNCLKFSLILTK